MPRGASQRDVRTLSSNDDQPFVEAESQHWYCLMVPVVDAAVSCMANPGARLAECTSHCKSTTRSDLPIKLSLLEAAQN